MSVFSGQPQRPQCVSRKCGQAWQIEKISFTRSCERTGLPAFFHLLLAEQRDTNRFAIFGGLAVDRVTVVAFILIGDGHDWIMPCVVAAPHTSHAGEPVQIFGFVFGFGAFIMTGPRISRLTP